MAYNNVLVSGYVGFNNFGDEAIFLALSKHLKTLGFNVSVLCANKLDVKNKYDVTAYKYNSFFQVIKGILKCNILISGGGSLLQNKTSNFSLYYYLLIIISAKLFFKRVMIFAQGIEPVKGRFNNLLLVFVLRCADYITVRDGNSLKFLKDNNIKANLVSDPVYSILENIKPCGNKKGLIVQLRNYKNIDDMFLKRLAKAIFDNCKYTEITVMSLQEKFDKDLCLKFIDILKDYKINAFYKNNDNVEDTIQTINKAEYMISTRLHGIIVSNALKTKTLALIYDDKVRTIVDELNIQNIDTDYYLEDEIDEKIKIFFNSDDFSKKNREFSWHDTDEKLMQFKE